MKKAKELLLFLAVLVIPLVLFILVSPLTADVISDKPSFAGIVNFIRMFLHDKTFGKALLNTILPPAIVSFLLVSAFAIIVFLIRKKIKVRRGMFYLGSVIIGGVTSLIYSSYLSITFSHMTSNLFAAQTIISHIVDYKPSVFDAITFPNMLFYLYIGILTAFVFWILELISDIIKNFRKKRNTK